MDKLTLNHLAPYLPYNLTWTIQELKTFTMIGITSEQLFTKEGAFFVWPKHPDLPQALFPLLRPLSQLTQEIVHNGETLVFTELFEIGDDGGYNSEFDHGNIKVINRLKQISIFNLHYDINYLPFQVVQEMFKYHFDVFGLLDKGLALPLPLK